jgi:sugar lactone lactonase YvrE
MKRDLLFIFLFCSFCTPASAQIITTIAGFTNPITHVNTCGTTGDNGPATAALIMNPMAVCHDAVGNLYIGTNGTLRKIHEPTGIITTMGNITGTALYADSVQASSSAIYAWGICMDIDGNLLVADGGTHRLRKINLSTGIITTLAGTPIVAFPGSPGYSGDGGPATAAQLDGPTDVAVDAMGNIYIADEWNTVVRKITIATGIITTVAGTTTSFGGDGGPATDARLGHPWGICLDTAGNIYIADRQDLRIRKVTAATGIITTIAGTGVDTINGIGGPATAAAIGNVYKLAMDDSGNLYISTGTAVYLGVGLVGSDGRILKLHLATGIITNFAGGRNILPGMAGYPGDGRRADSAYLEPYGMCFDTSGNMYVADDICLVRKIAWPHSTASVAEAPVDAGIQVYPNPSQGTLTVAGIQGSTVYTLVSATGRQVLQGTLQHSSTMDIHSLAPGMYILQLTGQGGERSRIKVLKE